MIKESLLSLALQCAPSIHPETIFDVAKVESGFNPFAIAEIVTKDKIISHLPKSKSEAIKIIERLETNKIRFSVGLMQIYSGNFKGYQVTAEDMLNPCKNLNIAEKILVDCYKRGGNLKNALSCYYSGNFETGKKKEKAFSNTSYIERIGGKNKNRSVAIVVPSTKDMGKTTAEKDNQIVDKIAVNQKKPRENSVVYPSYIVRGQVIKQKYEGVKND